MIIVKLRGGLGNQMFQYATGCRLAHVHSTELKLDLEWFDTCPHGDTPRRYELGAFNIGASVATLDEIHKFRQDQKGGLSRSLDRLNPFFTQTHIREKHYSFDRDILDLPDNVYLDGYWQSGRYFADILEIIRQEFSAKTSLTLPSVKLGEQISKGESVSIHVRRGDYISKQKTSAFHGVCGIDYYQRASAFVVERLGCPKFYIFSDDPEWVEQHLDMMCPAGTACHISTGSAVEDLQLMALCRHHIVANSSFSWWGAWLSLTADKIVIAPRTWFADSTIDTSDLLPAEWIRI